LIWALAHGLPETGLSFFYLDEGPDSGDLLWQRAFPIGDNDDAGTLYARVEELAGEAIREFLPLVAAGLAPRTPQNHALATYWPKRTERDGEINWIGSARVAHNLVRALARPYPGAHTFLEGDRMIVWKTGIRDDAAVPPSPALPGEIVSQAPHSFVVRCGDGLLEVICWEGGRRGLRVGARLGSSS
jgi:methionyl-tRNA formyltransferase